MIISYRVCESVVRRLTIEQTAAIQRTLLKSNNLAIKLMCVGVKQRSPRRGLSDIEHSSPCCPPPTDNTSANRGKKDEDHGERHQELAHPERPTSRHRRCASPFVLGIAFVVAYARTMVLFYALLVTTVLLIDRHSWATAAISPTIQRAASNIFQRYMTTLASHPLPTKMITGAILATAGDAIAQGREGGKYNAVRGTSFAAFDSTYRAAQHHLFPLIVEYCRGRYLLKVLRVAAIGATTESSAFFDISSLAAMERSLASQLIIVPFMYYPVFFAFTAWMQGLTFDEGLQRATENFAPLMKRNLLFWMPVQYAQFAYVSTDLQIPFLSCASLTWTFILSVLAGSAKGYSSDDDSPGDTETCRVNGTEGSCIISKVDDFVDENDGSAVSSELIASEEISTV